MFIVKFLLGILLVCASGVTLAFIFGPREKVKVSKIQTEFVFGDDLETYLEKRESAYSDIKTGQRKQIIWANPDLKDKTEYSVVYVHGFSASLQETRPLTDIIAKELGANIFFTRLAGHSRGGDAMGEPFVRHWLSDTAEAMAIGRQLGDKVIVISASTGSTLVSWAMTNSAASKNVYANIFISPNFGVVNSASALFTLPFARNIVPLVAGERRVWDPQTELERTYWSWNYPSTALVTMGVAVKFAKSLNYAKVTTPTYFSYSVKDEVVKSTETDAIYVRWGGPKKRNYVEVSDDELFHVNAGEAKSPSTTQPLAEELLAWLKALN